MSSNLTPATAAFRISSQQERAWSQQEKGARSFAQCVLRISVAADMARVQQALERMIAKHEILRTALQKQAGVKLPFQVIQSTGKLQFQHMQEVQALEDLLRAARQSFEAAEPFGLQAIL